MRLRAFRKPVSTLDRGTEHRRPGKVLSINGATANVRVYVGSGFCRTKSCATVDLPSAVIGAPVAVQLSSTHPDSSTITRVVGSTWAVAPRSEATAASDDGIFPIIPRDITGETETVWEGYE